MKKTAVVLLLLIVTVFTLSADTESLLSSSTARLFTNATDYIIRPNVEFNKQDRDFVIALGDMGLDTGNVGQGSAELGYYRHGDYPFALSTSMFLSSISKGEVQSELDWDALVRFTMGLPKVMDMSFGLVMNSWGAKNVGQDNYGLSFSFPIGLQIGPVYNYAHPYIIYESPNKRSEPPEEKGNFNFVFYDKVTFFSLIPGGVETNAWIVASLDSFSPDLLPFIEMPGIQSAGNVDTEISGQAGIANRYDFSPVDSIKLIVNPKIYIDWYLIEKNYYELAVTAGSDAGIYYRPRNGAFGFFFAMTPCVLFSYNRANTDQISEFMTTINWTGRLGATLYLPNEITLDVACNVNTTNNPFEIKVQMTFGL